MIAIAFYFTLASAPPTFLGKILIFRKLIPKIYDNHFYQFPSFTSLYTCCYFNIGDFKRHFVIVENNYLPESFVVEDELLSYKYCQMTILLLVNLPKLYQPLENT